MSVKALLNKLKGLCFSEKLVRKRINYVRIILLAEKHLAPWVFYSCDIKDFGSILKNSAGRRLKIADNRFHASLRCIFQSYHRNFWTCIVSYQQPQVVNEDVHDTALNNLHYLVWKIFIRQERVGHVFRPSSIFRLLLRLANQIAYRAILIADERNAVIHFMHALLARFQ